MFSQIQATKGTAARPVADVEDWPEAERQLEASMALSMVK